MSKCPKVKNPCKLCFRSVTTKTGIQCKGVCKKWVHFKCLNYTPGKIRDIKAGLVGITCPCPDCNSSETTEVFVESPYACTNFQCPASLPICESTECPSTYHITKQSYMAESCPSSMSSTTIRPRCSVKKCEQPPLSISISCPPDPPPCPNSFNPPFMKKCDVFPHKPCPPPTRCPKSSCTHTTPLPRQVCSKPKICKNKMCSPIRSLSCSVVGDKIVCNDSYKVRLKRDKNEGCDAETAIRCISSSDSELSKARETQKSLYCTMEQMCVTVGQLSNQLKELMCRMMEVFEKTRKCD